MATNDWSSCQNCRKLDHELRNIVRSELRREARGLIPDAEKVRKAKADLAEHKSRDH